jgi:hypothetical protein
MTIVKMAENRRKKMRHQILKGVAIVMFVVVPTLVSTFATANAQSTQLVRADVPFEFIVGNQTMPSGKYNIASVTNQGDGLAIRSADNGSAAIRLSDSIESKKNNTQARLVFHRYGQRYFLAEVWRGGDTTGRLLHKSKEEKAIERELASMSSRKNLARNSYEVVEIVATAD